jgi:two-component system sensor histidine kinase CpxA
MRIFIRMMAICWIIMLILASAVIFWPTATAPVLDDRQRAIPILLLQACAKDAAQQYSSSHEFKSDTKCPTGRLVAPTDYANSDLLGHPLSSDERRTVTRAVRSHTTAFRFMPNGTLVAFGANPVDPQSVIYLATLSLPERNFFLWHLNRAGRLIFISGLLSLLVAAYFVRPITRLSSVAERFGAGDLKARVAPRMAKRKDELGDLGRTFNEMADSIQSMVERYKSFLAHASHELGSPITRLNIALALARRKAGPALDQEHDRIQREAGRLNTLVQELLLLARLESGNELSRQQVSFQVGPVVQEALENATFEAQEIGKKVFLIGMEEFFVDGHPDLLLRAIDNILRNGLRFAQHEVHIHVSLVKKQGVATGIIMIEDDGRGITAGMEDAIFEPFFTAAENSDSDVSQGSGLGLAIAKQAAMANGGVIFAQKSSLGGLAVVIELPSGVIES